MADSTPDTWHRRWPSMHSELTLGRLSYAKSSGSVCSCDEEAAAAAAASPPLIPRVPTTRVPTPVGFFDRSLAQTRRVVLLEYGKILSILCLFVLAVLSLYWGIQYGLEGRMNNLTVAVVDFDGAVPFDDITPIVGPALVDAVAEELLKPSHLGYHIVPAATFGRDPLQVRVAVHDQRYWAAILINRNATALLQNAISQGNSSYDPHGVGQIIYNQARDQETYNQFVMPQLTDFATRFATGFARNWTRSVLENSRLDVGVYVSSPQALSPAVAFSTFNLRPFGPATAYPAVTVGLIYLIIIAFFSFGFFMPTHMKLVLSPAGQPPHPPLKFHQLIVWRYAATIVAYLFMSLFYSLVSLAFRIPFSHTPAGSRHWTDTAVVSSANYYGHATFVVYWMVNFVGMCALGLACENIAMLLGQPWTALWLIFWVITNVATGFYSLELAPRFYGFGWAWPLRQIVDASRTLLFGTHDRLAVNFGILVAWVAISTVIFPFACSFLRWKTMREKARSMAAAPPPPREKLPTTQTPRGRRIDKL